jgi:hypothetical protein
MEDLRFPNLDEDVAPMVNWFRGQGKETGGARSEDEKPHSICSESLARQIFMLGHSFGEIKVATRLLTAHFMDSRASVGVYASSGGSRIDVEI